MTQVKYNTKKEILQEALSKNEEDILKQLLKEVLQEIWESERDDQIEVNRYNRNPEERVGSRNGYKLRTFKTRVGKLQLNKPQIRKFPFKTSLFENYQRSEKALLLTIQQVVLDGVSTNKVNKVLHKLAPGLECSKSSASRLVVELEPIIQALRHDKLEENFKCLISDGTYFHVRDNNHVVTIPALITCGVNSKGYRRILGCDIYDEESAETWREHIRKL
ncbi:MAG: transposase [bacterium]|nr:transposase [bacterium]